MERIGTIDSLRFPQILVRMTKSEWEGVCCLFRTIEDSCAIERGDVLACLGIAREQFVGRRVEVPEVLKPLVERAQGVPDGAIQLDETVSEPQSLVVACGNIRLESNGPQAHHAVLTIDGQVVDWKHITMDARIPGAIRVLVEHAVRREVKPDQVVG